jgi:hypothetical protein
LQCPPSSRDRFQIAGLCATFVTRQAVPSDFA